MTWAVLWVGLFVLGITGCERKLSSPTDPSLETSRVPVPSGLSARVGDGRVILDWTLSAADSAQVARFLVYRTDSSGAPFRVVDSVVWPPYVDSTAVNGVLHDYAVSARNQAGLEGLRSSALRAQARFVSVRINEDSMYTRLPDVRLALTAPGATLVRFGNDSLSPSDWRSVAAVLPWTVLPGAGVKRVFAQFQFSDGADFDGWVSDSILLDDRSEIRDVTISDSVLAPGDTLIIVLDAGETGGTATYDLASRTSVRMFDDGAWPDLVSDDGRFSAAYIAGVGDLFEARDVVGRFTDRAGNRAAPFTSSRTVSVRQPPDAPVWVGVVATANEPNSLELSWTGVNAEPFSQLILRRSTTSGSGTSAPVVALFTTRTTSHRDTGLAGSTTYFYTLEIVLANGLRALSLQTSGTTPVDLPPDPVLVAVTPTGDTTLLLSWTQSTAQDFESYRVYRALTSPALAPSPPADSLLVSIGTSAAATTYTEAGPTRSYYYRVFVFDKAGQRTGSNVVWGPKDFGPP